MLSTFLGISKMNEDKWKSKTEFSYESAYYTLADSLLNMEEYAEELGSKFICPSATAVNAYG